MKTDEIGTLNNPLLLRNTLLSVAANEAEGKKLTISLDQLELAAEMFFGRNVWQGIDVITPREVRAVLAERAERDRFPE